MSEEVKTPITGLSPSSFGEFTACNRKWFLRKVAKVAIDPDASEDYAAFNFGKAFHKALEDTKHNLESYTHAQTIAVCAEFGVVEPEEVAMIFAMLGKYKQLHAIDNLKVVACETIINTPEFYGIVDAVMEDKDGVLWIVDIKTAATWQTSNIATASSHPQLNLYAKYFDVLAYGIGRKDAPFGGIRLRTTTKSKLIKKASESMPEYILRMMNGIKSNDLAIRKEDLNVDRISSQHLAAFARTSQAQACDSDKFAPNYGNCMSYFRPCNYYSQCHGRTFSDTPTGILFTEA